MHRIAFVYHGCNKLMMSSKKAYDHIVVTKKGKLYYWFKSRFYPTNNYCPVVVATSFQMKSFHKCPLAYKSRSSVFWKIVEMYMLLFDLLGLKWSCVSRSLTRRGWKSLRFLTLAQRAPNFYLQIRGFHNGTRNQVVSRDIWSRDLGMSLMLAASVYFQINKEM